MYRHGEDGIGGLETVRPLLPQVPVPLDGGDVPPDPRPRLRHQQPPDPVPRRQRLRGAEPAHAAAHHHALRRHPPRRRRLVSAAVPGGDGGVAGDRAPNTPGAAPSQDIAGAAGLHR